MPAILIVDDDPVQRLLLRETLTGHPLLSFTEAADGAEALRLIRANLPALMLLDVTMPKMDGLTVCRTIKSDPRLKDIYILLVTSLDGSQDRAAGLAAGADDYLSKPYEAHDLWHRVSQALHLDTL